jgi:hypothetical protein
MWFRRFLTDTGISVLIIDALGNDPVLAKSPTLIFIMASTKYFPGLT